MFRRSSREKLKSKFKKGKRTLTSVPRKCRGVGSGTSPRCGCFACCRDGLTRYSVCRTFRYFETGSPDRSNIDRTKRVRGGGKVGGWLRAWISGDETARSRKYIRNVAIERNGRGDTLSLINAYGNRNRFRAIVAC